MDHALDGWEGLLTDTNHTSYALRRVCASVKAVYKPYDGYLRPTGIRLELIVWPQLKDNWSLAIVRYSGGIWPRSAQERLLVLTNYNTLYLE